MSLSLGTSNSWDSYLSDYDYTLSKASEKNVVNIIKKASKESLSQILSPSILENIEANYLHESLDNFFPNIGSKKYIGVLENNLRRYLEPIKSLNPEPRLHSVTPVTIQKAHTSGALDAWAAPIQTFEGRVINVIDGEVMDVILVDKTGCMPDHEATIELQWVSDQDRDLVKLGAIFYLSLYKQRSQSGSIRNSEEIRFRRLPSWSHNSIDGIRTKADELLKTRFNTATLDNS